MRDTRSLAPFSARMHKRLFKITLFTLCSIIQLK